MIGKFSFAQLRREYIEELIRDGDEKAKSLLGLYERPVLFLGTAQLGMAVSVMMAGATVFYGLMQSYPWFLDIFGGPTQVGIVYVIICVIMCLMMWVFGELIPKSIGLQEAESSLKRVSKIICAWGRFVRPIIRFGNWLGKVILNSRQLEVTNEIDIAHSEDEIRMLVTVSRREGKIDQAESELIDNVFNFADRLAKEIMVPRQDIVCMYAEKTMQQNLKTIRQLRHTRYPLCEEDKDHVLGLVHIKDLMDLYLHKHNNICIAKRPILMIPEIMPALKLLQLMRARRIYLAMVVDEYGSTVGLIGLEDILEELVGNIRNEHTVEKEEIVPLSNGAYEFDGTVLLDDVEELLHIPVEENVDTDTIGGYVFNLLGHTPSIGDTVLIGKYKFIVMEVNRFRIARLKAMIIPENERIESPEKSDDHEGED